ncbi:aminoglycoside phosphotransferase family protein [Ilumatobacter nonamiensis]|uniref:aminoglycoside phosphotransferase family protein n=1 Tax=Ilumatobacter nonamiensis TaxID=467093 RepID=UPI000348A05D|nr:aminoglycoside phosphotransferase family protein [Ilumatobacter nonamiensis]
MTGEDDIATTIDDAVLPAAVHLTGEHAPAILAPAVEMAGGRLVDARPVSVQYRPGSDLVVQFTCQVEWPRRGEVRETIVASSTVYGEPPGTVPIEAEAPDGTVLRVGVWRWPFDPSLPALEDAVVSPRAAVMFSDVAVGDPHLEVVAYRPTERAVIRATDRRGQFYVKLVAPATTHDFVTRHERLRAAGLPVPNVLAFDANAGWIALEALLGDTFRVRLKEDRHPWPKPDDILELCARLAPVDSSGAPPVRSRVSDAIAHAQVLASVAPEHVGRLDALVEAFSNAEARSIARRGPTVHGDLHEGQLILDGRDGAPAITGLLDIDDVGPGDPIGDLGTLLAHLTFRASQLDGDGAELRRYIDDLTPAFAAAVDPGELRIATAAVLVGLATGPFRIQHPGWRAAIDEQLTNAEELLR